MKKRLIISGSPRKQGRSSRLTRAIVKKYQSEDPEVLISVFSLSEYHVGFCTACDCCGESYHCVIEDDMQLLYPLIDASDDLTIVSPVFFAGPPAQMKAVLDRFQPYFWKSRKEESKKKRTGNLYIVGEGGDPHGFEPLVISTRSALAVAGFSLENIYDLVMLEGTDLDEAARNPEAYRYKSPPPPDSCLPSLSKECS